ncbi:glycosaminoglycan xylosylkinase-like isoform X1 [Penaeus monodon]|uniref:glycosaminoglycan xylosylkinase-like isoform X1 n=1 Tax=Penaeus monodon TaxID=6687 RepID=UPI0018A75335|nr:glycosaminoglycan xylosylkinase-like isoform X1 [Penaeus monodon]XP_037773130.1 glycosaminoglycan xylosylkinase-like isoform X1 [Penaeus monodon]
MKTGRRKAIWRTLCFAVTLALTIFLRKIISNLRNKSAMPLTRLTDSERVLSEGEFYVLKNAFNYKESQHERTGLRMLPALYKHLPAIRAKYSVMSPQIPKFIAELKEDLKERGITKKPWKLARQWAKPTSLTPASDPGLGDVLAALSTANITTADLSDKGSQLKIILKLEGGQTVIFKPMRYSRDESLEDAYFTFDRHNGEIVAFHLSRVLDMRMAPLTVGRKISLETEILPVSTKRLSDTVFRNEDGDLCIFGNCVYCSKKWPACEKDQYLEGAVITWLPEHYISSEPHHPWGRTYIKNKLADWEKDARFCQTVLRTFHPRKLLDLIDAAVFDFLIQNVDRHHFAQTSGAKDSPVVLIDNAKSVGNAFVDWMDILAPVLQCCRMRRTTYKKLVFLSGGGLSQAMQELLAFDPVAPVLTPAHLRAMDRRVLHVLAAMEACVAAKGGGDGVLF